MGAGIGTLLLIQVDPLAVFKGTEERRKEGIVLTERKANGGEGASFNFLPPGAADVVTLLGIGI